MYSILLFIYFFLKMFIQIYQLIILSKIQNFEPCDYTSHMPRRGRALRTCRCKYYWLGIAYRGNPRSTPPREPFTPAKVTAAPVRLSSAIVRYRRLRPTRAHTPPTPVRFRKMPPPGETGSPPPPPSV